MAIRIKSRWHDSGRNESVDKGWEESAGALAFIAWRVSTDKAVNLHGENFNYRSDGQRIAVICEYLAFCVQVADRLAYRMLEDDERPGFVTTLAQRIADHVEDNAIDLFGPGEYRTGFIKTLNDRSGAYSEYEFAEDGPNYSFIRHLGHCVQDIMGRDQTNKWAIDQVMEIDAPDVIKKIRSSMVDLFE